MKLKKFKETNNKRIGIIAFTIVCIMLVAGAVFYRTFAIFEVKTNQNVINGTVQGMGDIEFAFYQNDGGSDGDKIVKEAPKKEEGYILNTEKSKCIDLTTGEQSSNISWDNEKWEANLKNIKTTKTKCYLHFDKLYIDSTLKGDNGSVGPIPDLGNEMVAITIDEANGRAKKADLTTAWYNYGEQKWANAVILKNGSADDYTPGDEIPEENIESYFVWIPRYSYTIWNGVSETSAFTGVIPLGNITDATQKEELNKAQKIEIKFETKNDAVKRGTDKGTSLTHPAFLSFDSNGFWVGKFETSNNGSAANDSRSPEAIQIKPGVASWRSIRVANAFYTVYNYKRELESHMMKNMEWGAVAYLTNSKYGRCSGEKCEEVRINNNSDGITGSSAVKEPTCGYTSSNDECNRYGTSSETTIVSLYNNPASTKSSTTGNYYGVFDMAGGAWEYVMGVMLDKAGKPASGRNDNYNSNFVGTLTYPNDGKDTSKDTWTTVDGGLPWPDLRYYDTYAYDTSDQQLQRGLFGDGTIEFGPFYQVVYSETVRRVSSWNADDALFVDHDHPWFRRGGDYTDGTDVGLGASLSGNGQATGNYSFRVILTP